MFSQMCEAVAVCHDAGVSHRDIKPENFICCDSVELESVTEAVDDDDDETPDFGPQAKRKVIVKLTDFGLATTEYESGDVECGSKPYMSYECRNNLGPTYSPPPADVWSLGIVLINMLFHRNPWKDPTEGDPNFDTFLEDPLSFLQTKFTGIGKEVATYLAEHVLATDVEDRVTARQLGQWVRTLPEMIAGRRAVRDLKKQRLETRAKQAAGDKGLFVKSPVGQFHTTRSVFTSALTSSAPITISPSVPVSVMARLNVSEEQECEYTPSLATLPPVSELTNGSALSSHATSLANAAPIPDLDREEIRSATTVDDHPTPTDMSTMVSPEPTEGGDSPIDLMDIDDKDDNKSERSASTHKRRKRGVRKGKAAQAAAAAAASGVTQEERESFLSELVQASEELARDLSTKKRFDASRPEDFPPLGTSPAEVATARKSKWKDLLAMSKGNPQLEALARRVAERDNQTWSAPANLQQGLNHHVSRHQHLRHTATTSSALSSQLSSIAATESSAASSFIGGPDDDDWRRPARQREEEMRAREREREKDDPLSSRRGTEDSSSRQRQAALAAAAIAGGLEPMGAFGKPSHLGRPVPLNHRPSHPANAHRPSPLALDKERWAPPTSSVPVTISPAPPPSHKHPRDERPTGHRDFKVSISAAAPTSSHISISQKTANKMSPNGSAHNLVTFTSTSSNGTLNTLTAESPQPHTPAVQASPSKPKVKGQMHGLAKMFGGLKTKGRD
jgi:serine/threonine protein kinase